MSARSWTDRVRDILEAITEIQGFVRGVDQTAFTTDIKTIRAVELNFIVIGEAATNIPDDVQQAHPEIPWAQMKAMRNRLVHAYFSVDPTVVWDTIGNDLPPLVGSLQRLLLNPVTSPTP